ncbi:3-hydroxyacyl-CoA dehydrogenase [Aspergillus heterothallicus]
MTSSQSRPVVVLGAGILGRRIASVFVAGGYKVHIRDPSAAALTAAAEFIDANRSAFTALTPTPHPASGEFETFTDLPAAVIDAWLVVEAVPEILELKTDIFGEVDQYAPADCVLASNSSSYKSGLMVDKVKDGRRAQVLNMHFTMPPGIRTVELMTCGGETRAEVLEEMSRVLARCGMVPVTARKESTGFIFNRLWAAIKREILYILAEDVSSPEEIDLLWTNMFQLPESLPPCQLMDKIGLSTVALIEDNYIQERGLDGRMTVDWLRENYIAKGKIGSSSDKGGLYGPSAASDSQKKENQTQALYLLDVGLGSNNADIAQIPTAGRILHFSPSTGEMKTLVGGQSLPDGIDISRSTGRMFWTNMGHATSTHDGSVHSAKLDGSDIQILLPPGSVHTPKQLVVDDTAGKVYFCDREGMGVHRCNFDGSQHEILVQTGRVPENKGDMTRWCVGITLDKARGYVYWTQKGPSKSGQGRIFRAGINVPAGETAESRTDIKLLLDNLPEPIDLELDEQAQRLYWTDRGEHPLGCSLNSVDLSEPMQPETLRPKMATLARHFNEPIGLKLGPCGEIYVGDLGGSIYRVENGEKTRLWRDDSCYTGISL